MRDTPGNMIALMYTDQRFQPVDRHRATEQVTLAHMAIMTGKKVLLFLGFYPSAMLLRERKSEGGYGSPSDRIKSQ